MNYNRSNTILDECIFILKNSIPSHVCDAVIQDIETREWQSHSWYDPNTGESESEETMELDIQWVTPELQKLLSDFIIKAGTKYNQTYAWSSNDKTTEIMDQFNSIRFNRYEPGQIMRQHYDHIHSIFDGKIKGVPVVSFILNFNDDYEGGDLFFWKDTVVKLGKGDICMFPSNFLFPHGVTEVTKGKRYSGVCWGW